MLKNDKTIKFCIVFYWLIQSLNATFIIYKTGGFPGGSEVKASACNAGDLGSISGSGRSPGEGNGNPLQYCCLENPMERSLTGYSPRGRRESKTERLTFTFTAAPLATFPDIQGPRSLEASYTDMCAE